MTDSKKDFWESMVAIAPEKLISQRRLEAEAILKENNTNIFHVTPEKVHKKPQLYLAQWYDYDNECDCRYERRGDWEVFALHHDYDERVIWKYQDMILDYQKHDGKYLKILQLGDISVKISARDQLFKDTVVKHTDESGTEKTFRVQNGEFLDYLLEISRGVVGGINFCWIAILDDEKYSRIDYETNVEGLIDLRQIREKRPDGTEIEYEERPELSRSLFKPGYNDGLTIFQAMENLYRDDPEKIRTVLHGVLKKISHDDETSFYINDIYLGKMVVDTEKPKGEYHGILESVTHCYDCNGKLVEEYIETSVDSEHVWVAGTTGYVFLNTYFDNGNIKMHKMLAGEGLNSGNAAYYDPNSGKCIATTKYNGSLMYACDDPESRKAMKDRFENAIKKNDLSEAKLALNMIFQSLSPFGDPKERHTDYSLLVRNDLHKFAIKVLGDGKIAIGGIYEDRHWTGESFRGGGIEWYWKASAVVVDLQDDACGIVAECHTDRINVRHRYDPNLDLWNKLDDDFMKIDERNGKLTVGLKRKGRSEWEISADIDLTQKIAEYEKVVASVKHDSTTPKIKSAISEKVEQFRKASEQQLNDIQLVNTGGHEVR